MFCKGIGGSRPRSLLIPVDYVQYAKSTDQAMSCAVVCLRVRPQLATLFFRSLHFRSTLLPHFDRMRSYQEALGVGVWVQIHGSISRDVFVHDNVIDIYRISLSDIDGKRTNN